MSKLSFATELARAVALTVAAYAILYLIVPGAGAPGGALFALFTVFVAAVYLGGLSGWIGDASGLKLPPLLGMLIAGFLLKNLPFVDTEVGDKVNPAWSSAIRTLALTMILCRAGLGLDLAALSRMRFVVARLACMPCLAEAGTVALFAYFVMGFKVWWAVMFGFVIAPISPAVVIPSVLSLQDRGYGGETGIAPMMVAAAALDDVLSIFSFGLCMSYATSGGSMNWFDYSRVVVEPLAGLVVGLAAARLLVVLAPASDGACNKWHAVWLFNFAVICMFALNSVEFKSASAIAVLVLACGAVRFWGKDAAKPVGGLFANVWNHLAQPFLFGLVGAQVSLKDMEVKDLGLGLGLLACSLTARTAAAFLAVGGKGLRWQERLFVALGWLPKATVQAAIGSLALLWAQDQVPRDAETMRMAHSILTISTLAILCTAPAGAAIISALGPKLLRLEVAKEAEDPAVVAIANLRKMAAGSFRPDEEQSEQPLTQMAGNKAGDLGKALAHEGATPEV